jgi:hypothetical protein
MQFKSQNRTKLALLKGSGAPDLVMVRGYGAITAVILDDSETSENCSFRLGTPFYSEFLEPFEQTSSDFPDEINRLHTYVTNEGQAQLGLLAMMRTAIALREGNLDEKAALQHAVETSNRLVQALMNRLKIIDTVVKQAGRR